MKITPLLITLSLAAGLTLRAQDEKKPAKDSAAEEKSADSEKPAKAAEGADAAWEELEKMLKGPSERPKTREEMMAAFKKHLGVIDEKSAAFIKAYPADVRRWKLKVHEIQVNPTRGMVGLEPKSEEEIAKIVTEILDAPDADKETKGFASFSRVMAASENPDELKKLAEVHLKEYPDFRGNRQIDMEIKKAETAKLLKEKPLELKFTSTEGKEIDLSKMRGKVVLVDFWATWCGPCIQEIPNVVAAYEKLHDKGFEIIGIAFEREGDDDKLAKMTKEKKMPWPQYYDGLHWKNKFGVQFGINGIPAMWLVDKKGMVVDFNARGGLEEKVEKLLAE